MNRHKKRMKTACLFIDKALQDKSKRKNCVDALVGYRNTCCWKKLGYDSSIAFFASSLIYGCFKLCMSYDRSVPIGLVLSIVGLGFAVYLRKSTKAWFCISQTNKNLLPQDKRYIDSKEDTFNYLGELTMSDMVRLGEYVKKKYPDLIKEIENDDIARYAELEKNEKNNPIFSKYVKKISIKKSFLSKCLPKYKKDLNKKQENQNNDDTKTLEKKEETMELKQQF